MMSAMFGICLFSNRELWSSKPKFTYFKSRDGYHFTYFWWFGFSLFYDECVFAEDVCFLPTICRGKGWISLNWLIFGIEIER